jgi:hypothetical protein
MRVSRRFFRVYRALPADVWMKPVPLAELQYRLFGSVDLQAHIAPDSGSYDSGHIVVRTMSKAAC